MRVALSRVAAPAGLPITLAAVKEYLRQDYTDQDQTINSLMAAAVRQAEDLTSRCLMQQDWVLGLPHFPWYRHSLCERPTEYGMLHPHNWSGFQTIRLPRAPVTAVMSITYYDPNGVQQTLDPSLYQVDLLSEPQCIAPAPNTTWPPTQSDRLNAVQITFRAGYTDANPMPESVIQALFLMIASWYENREDITVGAYAQAVPRGADFLLSLNRLTNIGFEVAT